MKALAAFLALAASACASSTPLPPPKRLAAEAPVAAAEAAEDALPIPIGASDAVRGNRLAPVTVVVFSDFQCPYCSKLAKTLDRLHEAYGDDVLRVVFKNSPLSGHDHAELAAEVGQGVLETVGNGAFWRFHNKAFKEQDSISPAQIRAWAVSVGASAKTIDDGLANKTWTRKIEGDLMLSRSLRTSGTPASFINGQLLVGAKPFETFTSVIDTELARANVLVAQGVPKDQVYARALAANLAKGDPDDDDAAEEAAAAAEAKKIYRVPVGKEPIRGAKTALVTIVEFSDYQCPFCKRGEETLDKVRREYGDKVRIVWRDLPLSFHPRAEPAAELARAARAQKGDAGFWAVHDLLFASQPNLEDADLERIANEAKLDTKKALAAVQTHAYKREIEDDNDVADDFEATGTPHFFVNGRRFVGAQPFEKFKVLIDAEIERARALPPGTMPDKVYETLVKDGIEAAGPVRKALAAPPPNAPFRGAANGKVLIQEVGDFQCPFCKRGDATMDELLKAYPGKLKIVWRDKPLPMHPDAPLAAEAAREAFAQKGNEGFDRMHKLLFENQRALARTDLEGYARAMGLDMARFGAALDRHIHKPVIEADDKATSEAAVEGTPAFFIGPYFIGGAQPYSSFRRLVDRVLAEEKGSRLR